MPNTHLESVLTSSLPSFAPEWEAYRRAYGTAPTDADLLALLRAHVVRLLAAGRVAETTRFFHTVERALIESDPVLCELLERALVAPLAADCRAAAIDSRRIAPYLGVRTRAAWGTIPERPSP